MAAFSGAGPPESATLATPIRDPADLFNPAVVKFLVGRDGNAVSFSRHPIPWREDLRTAAAGLGAGTGRGSVDASGYLRHIGVYAYRRPFLLRYARLARTPFEISERLEQLRALEHGFEIAVPTVAHRALEVDTPEDVALVEAALKSAAH